MINATTNTPMQGYSDARQMREPQPLEGFGPIMTKEEVAKVLRLPSHIIAPLTRAGVLEPLGQPKRYCVKHYSRDVLARNMVNPDWLDKMVGAIHRHWRTKNARKRSKTERHSQLKQCSQAL